MIMEVSIAIPDISLDIVLVELEVVGAWHFQCKMRSDKQWKGKERK